MNHSIKTPMKYFVIGSVILLVMTSCNGFLDRPEPTDVLKIETAIQNEQDIEQALLGAYALVRGMDNLLMIAPDLMADNAQWVGIGNTFPWRELNLFQYTPFNTLIRDFWQFGYRGINQANLVLLTLGEIPLLDPNFVDETRGEALFIRGLIYFELVRWYGLPISANANSDPGVPILIQPTLSTGEVSFPERASVQAVYDQAISDLTEASELLPELNEPYRAHQIAAKAYLARIAFQQQKYSQAASLANEIILSAFQLVREPQEVFLQEGSTEEIWFSPHNNQERGGLAGLTQTPSMILSLDLSSVGFDSVLSAKQWEALRAADLQITDLRKAHMTVPSPQPDQWMSVKYEDRNNGGDDGPLLRLAEFYLMRAEALTYTDGINQKSLDLLNAIRRRSLRVQDSLGQEVPDALSMITYQLEDFKHSEDLIQAIVAERRVELFLEGNRFHDLIRSKQSVKGLPYDDPKLRWPIPQSEIDANPNLVQNPGY